LGALRGRKKTAETILQNVGRQEPSMDGVSAAETPTAAVAESGGDSAADGDTDDNSDSDTDRPADSDTDDQSSLGDFG